MVLTNNFKRKQMQSTFRQHQFNTIAKCGGVMPSYWLAINTISLESDRTPSLGFREGAGYA
jgi:hypothetical protein